MMPETTGSLMIQLFSFGFFGWFLGFPVGLLPTVLLWLFIFHLSFEPKALSDWDGVFLRGMMSPSQSDWER